MKKICIMIFICMLLILCVFCVCAAPDEAPVTLNHVVYQLQETDKGASYTVVSLFDSKEAKQTTEEIVIADEINGIPVRAVHPIKQLEYGTEGELCWEATNPDVYINTVGATCKSISLPRSVQSIGDLSFYNMPHLKTVSLPDHLKTIGAHAFDGCSSLETINLPNTITEIDQNAFANCSALKKIRLPNQITVLKSCTFLNCNHLKSVQLGNQLSTISWAAFSGCEKLTKISLPKSLKAFYQGTFFNTGIEKLTVPEACNIFYFNGMTKLKAIAFADRAGNLKLPANCFSGLSALQRVELPQHANTTMARCVFARCPNLTKIVNSKSIVKISNKAFYRCKALSGLTLSKRLRSIADDALLCCEGLTKLRFTGMSDTLCRNTAFLQTLPDTCRVYVKTDVMKQAFLDAGCKNRVIVKADLK